MNKDFKFAKHDNLRDLVEDPLEEFYLLNEDSEEEPREIKRSFRDADKAIGGSRKTMI